MVTKHCHTFRQWFSGNRNCAVRLERDTTKYQARVEGIRADGVNKANVMTPQMRGLSNEEVVEQNRIVIVLD